VFTRRSPSACFNLTGLTPNSSVRPKGHGRASNANDGTQARGENRDCRHASTSFQRHSRSHEQACCFFFSVHSSADARPDHATNPVRLRRITARKTDWKSCPIERAAHFRHRHCPSVGPGIRNLWPQFKQNCALEHLCEKRAREETPQARMRRSIGPQDRSTRDSLRLDRSVQEICWLCAFAGSNPALPKPCIRADYRPPEPIYRHQAKEKNLLSLYLITSHNRCAKFGFLTQLDTNQTDSGQRNMLL
jgi:hypothetical protein